MKPRQRIGRIKKRVVVLLAGLTAITLAAKNLDSLATLWSKYFTQSRDLVAFGNPVNQPLAPPFPSLVHVELVQTPKEQTSDHLFDVYLKNTGPEDILLTEVIYGRGYVYTSAGTVQRPSGKFSPDSAYVFPVNGHPKTTAALSPPYLLKGRSRAAIRFKFVPGDNLSALGTLAFELHDASGKRVAAVNALRSD